MLSDGITVGEAITTMLLGIFILAIIAIGLKIKGWL
jgi:hypothetical protein